MNAGTQKRALVAAAVAAALLASASCSRLSRDWSLRCIVEPKPGQATEPHDTPTSVPELIQPEA
jgi:hypothetical protein